MQSLAVAPITSIDLMARRALKDDMPGIMLRGTIRSASKAVAQYAAAAPVADSRTTCVLGDGRARRDDRFGRDRIGRRAHLAHAAVGNRASLAHAFRRGTHTITLQTPEGRAQRAAEPVRTLRRGRLTSAAAAAFCAAPEAATPAGRPAATDARAAPAPSTGGRPKALEQQPHTMETPK